MTWEYSQRTGEMRYNGQLIAQAYSGFGPGKNNPSMERTRDTGPIPRGHYRISGHDNHKGAWTVYLSPLLGTDTFGRDHFLIHGDNPHTVGRSSHGCIIINGAQFRASIATSGDSILVVR